MFNNLNVKLFILLVINVRLNESSSAHIGTKKIMIEPSIWASKWFAKNKIQLISMTNEQLKFRLYQVLVNYSKMNQNIFDFIVKLVLKKKNLFLEKYLSNDFHNRDNLFRF